MAGTLGRIRLVQKPKGGARPGAGRKKGAINRCYFDEKANLVEMARPHVKTAIKNLARIADSKDATDSAVVAACIAILDRVYGRPAQAITGANGGPLQIMDLSRLTDEQLDALEPLLLAISSNQGPTIDGSLAE